MASIQEIAREQLSSGDTMRITKLMRQYTVTMLHADDSPPEMETGLNKRQAYTRWSEIVRHDVLELDD